ncbi:MAG TPA: permease prefix domain 1-containing protein, partial [Gemmatimonadales bacterium]|nr:permease prefix domain 1-containing protein [Gemmatimonadales bacterium]
MAEPGMAESNNSLEEQIGQWRSYLRRRQAIQPVDVAELEDHLRGEVATLSHAGLSENEAFLVAVKRMGALDTISSEFAREHSERLWKQLVIGSLDSDRLVTQSRREALVVFALAMAAAVAFKLPELFGQDWGSDASDPFYLRNFSLFVLPYL